MSSRHRSREDADLRRARRRSCSRNSLSSLPSKEGARNKSENRGRAHKSCRDLGCEAREVGGSDAKNHHYPSSKHHYQHHKEDKKNKEEKHAKEKGLERRHKTKKHEKKMELFSDPSLGSSNEEHDREDRRHEQRRKDASYLLRLNEWRQREEARDRLYAEEDERAARRAPERRKKKAEELARFLENYQDSIDDPKKESMKDLRAKFERERKADMLDREKEEEEEKRDREVLSSHGNTTQDTRWHDDPIIREARLALVKTREKVAKRSREMEEAEHVKQKRMENKEVLTGGKRRCADSVSVEMKPVSVSIPRITDSSSNTTVTSPSSSLATIVTAFPNKLAKERGKAKDQDLKGKKDAYSSHEVVSSQTLIETLAMERHSERVGETKNDEGGARLTESKESAASSREEGEIRSEKGESPKKRKHSENLPGWVDSNEGLSDVKRARIAREASRLTPKDKDALFAYPVKWPAADEVWVKWRLRPYLKKRLRELFTDDADTSDVVHIVCNHVAYRRHPQLLVDGLRCALGRHTEQFVVRIWRLLVYETEMRVRGVAVKIPSHHHNPSPRSQAAKSSSL